MRFSDQESRNAFLASILQDPANREAIRELAREHELDGPSGLDVVVWDDLSLDEASCRRILNLALEGQRLCCRLAPAAPPGAWVPEAGVGTASASMAPPKAGPTEAPAAPTPPPAAAPPAAAPAPPPAVPTPPAADKGHLVVQVQDGAGTPVEGAVVEVVGRGWSSPSDSAGHVDFGEVEPAAYEVRAEKRGYGAAAAGPTGPATAPAQVVANAELLVNLTLHSLQSVTRITARLPGTKGLRNPANQLPTNVLQASTSADESLAANPPVVLVRGCGKVELTAETNPPNQPVTWEVRSNENTDPPAAITPIDGGRKARLATGTHGSFSVIATLGGTRVVWNVVFVWVKVLVGTSLITQRNDQYADAGSGGGWTSFRSGQFSAGHYPWEAQVQIKVVGGSNTKRLGTDKIKLHLLHNGVTDTLTAHYAPPPPGSTAREVPRGGLPVRDSNGPGNPWMDNPTTVQPDNVGFQRTLWKADSPAGAFPMSHANTGTAISSISGVNGFVAAIAAVSDDAPSSIVVHAKTAWSADFAGDVDASGNYTPRATVTTVEARWNRISNATGGQDACDAGFETFEPRFNGGTDTTWTP